MSDTDFLKRLHLDSQDYLKTVIQLGDQQKVIASRDIYDAASGIKLVGRGIQIDSKLYDRLVQRKLIPHIDDGVSIENSVTVQDIEATAREILSDDPRLASVRAPLMACQPVFDALSGVVLNPPMSFKLTVMREKFNEMYRKSIFVALVSAYVAFKAGYERAGLIHVATAAMLHDIGLLHVDHQLLEQNFRYGEKELGTLATHPIIACMILRQYHEYPPAITDAVLQHHEHIDGSGYPARLKGGVITPFALMISLAEIVASQKFDASDDLASIRLEIILKLNSRKYGQHLIGHLKDFYARQGTVPNADSVARERLTKYFEGIANVFNGWNDQKDDPSLDEELRQHIDEQVGHLKYTAMDAGFDPESNAFMLAAVDGDDEVHAEACILAEEMVWQLKGIVRGVKRIWPNLASRQEGPKSGNLVYWMLEIEGLPESI